MSTIVSIISANLLISIISLSGVLTIAAKKMKSKNMISIWISFAAGTLLASAFLLVLHEAIEQGDLLNVLMITLTGVVLSFFLERFFIWHHHHHETRHNIDPSAVLITVGDGIHNFIDGVAIAASFIANPAIGWTSTLAVAAHEIPQEIADFSVLRHSGLSTKRALLLNFLSAITAVVGGIVGFYFLQSFGYALPLALGLTAGIFIYVAAADLIPELHEEHRAGEIACQVIPFLAGILLIYLISQTVVHSHEPKDSHDYEKQYEAHEEKYFGQNETEKIIDL